MSLTNRPQVLLFDVFGTVVEWRPSVTSALRDAAHAAITDPSKHLPAATLATVTSMTDADWLSIAEDWRKSYSHFTSTFDARGGQQPFISVDQHHYDAIDAILRRRGHGLDGLFTPAERWSLAQCWHRLTPWPDSAPGLRCLNDAGFRTCTLSNGNIALLEDLRRYGALPFTDIASAEHFGAYKPSPRAYLGAAEMCGHPPGQCAMVAAHLHDLKAAKACGLQTIYVARPGEETYDVEAARTEGFVDMWVGKDEEGLVEVARRFGPV
ncbi:haloacid dehalogenase, type II [Aspergillus ambiguus]|uniref:haloacid dehalogenase, type II n=1 Tax=Aspergillus ambiguus TaxID=176160 RepID=UPI003CCCC00C